MWISKKISNDPEIKKTLQEITKQIKRYSDATNISKNYKFFTIDIGRIFRPKLITYLIIIFAVTITAALSFLSGIITLSELKTWVSLSLTISVPILVLGISLATVAKNLSDSSRFASEYLKDSCRTTFVACIVFLTVLWGYLDNLLFPAVESSIVSMVIYFLLSSFSVGGAIWGLTSLIYIILETTKCMYPEFSIQAASNYASRKLSYACLKEAYLSAWIGKYQDKLKQELKKLKNIYPPSEYYSRELFQERKGGKSSLYKINFPQDINFHLGYRDYNLRKLEKINRILEHKNAKLYLTPHGVDPGEVGVLCCEKPCVEIYDTINKKLSSICRFRKDRHIEEEESFWEENYLKLRSSLLKATENADIAQFRKYLNSIEEIYVILKQARKHNFIRKHSNLDYKKYRYLLLYSKSVKWLLENTNKLEEDLLELFLYALVESVSQQVEDDIKNGDWYTLDALKWLIPDMYKSFHELVKDKKLGLWELRARIGGFYGYAGGLLYKHESNINKEDKLQIQLVLHKGIIKWLLMAIDNNDNELIKSLCEAAKKLVFPDKEMAFTPQQLVTQHFILCGKILEFLMKGNLNVPPDIFKSLCFDKYDHTAEKDISFEELVKFFIESRQSDLRSFLHEFSNTDWERNPLSGGGFGTPRYTFSGNIELDYMFIYLALLTSSRMPEEAKPIAFEFRGYSLKDKIDKFKDVAGVINIYDFRNSKDKLEKWLSECDQLYEQEEEERIATAPLDEEIVSEYKDAFWEGYKSVKTFLSFCLSQGHYSINNEVSVKHRYIQPKDIFIKEEASGGGVPRADGQDVSSACDRKLLKEIIKLDAESETADNITSQLNQACQWLTKAGTNRESGILLLYGNNNSIQRELYNNDYYVPSWREDRNLVFSGYYKNYPMIEIHDPEKDLKCVALNLQGWKGIKIRPEVLEKDILGDINVREWTEEEINEAIHKKEIVEKDRNKVKGNCPVEYELFWCLDEKDLPMQTIVSLKTEVGTS